MLYCCLGLLLLWSTVKQACFTDNLLDASHIHCLLSSAFLFVFTYDSYATMSSVICILLPPLGLLPIVLPSKIVSSMPSWRNTFPDQLCLLCCNVLKMDFSSPILFQTSSFVIFSVQLIFSILVHTQLSKASNCLCY